MNGGCTVVSVGLIPALPTWASSGLEVTYLRGGSTQEIRSWLLLRDGQDGMIGVVPVTAEEPVPDEVSYFGEGEWERIFQGSSISVTLEKGHLTIAHGGATEETSFALRVRDGHLEVAVGEANIEADCFDPATSPYSIPSDSE